MSDQTKFWNLTWTKLKIFVIEHTDQQQIRFAPYSKKLNLLSVFEKGNFLINALNKQDVCIPIC